MLAVGGDEPTQRCSKVLKDSLGSLGEVSYYSIINVSVNSEDAVITCLFFV